MIIRNMAYLLDSILQGKEEAGVGAVGVIYSEYRQFKKFVVP